MVDISMCCNVECETRRNCYRYTATPNEYRQSYSYFKCTPKKENFMCSSKPIADKALAKIDENNKEMYNKFVNK